MIKLLIARNPALYICLLLLFGVATGQTKPEKQKVRTVSIPISIFSTQEIRQGQAEELLQIDRLVVKEDGTEQTILSIRSVSDAPLALAVLVQDDLTAEFNLQLRDIANFIKSLPRGSRVMVAYIRGGSLQVRQKFTTDLQAAATTLRIVSSTEVASPRNPFDGVNDALDRFDALPAGRRAILLVSDGLDLSQGSTNSSPTQSDDLERAILRSQRRSVSIFAVYSPTVFTDNGNSVLILNGQGSLNRLADETGGRAFFQGSVAPVSFDPFFKDMRILLNRQFLLTYLSTNMKKRYYRVEVFSTNPSVKIEHPRGYYYR